MAPVKGRRGTAVLCVRRAVDWSEIAPMIPERILVAEPDLPSALARCFAGNVGRLVVDLGECDPLALSALAFLHSVRPEQEILLLDSGSDGRALWETSLADLPVAQITPRTRADTP